MHRLLLCLVMGCILQSCTSTKTIRRVCSKNGDTSAVVRYVQRNFGETEFDVARQLLETDEQLACWGSAGLVAAVLGEGEASALLRDRVEVIAGLDDGDVGGSLAGNLLLSVGIAARFDRDAERKAATVEYLTRLTDPGWWMARTPLNTKGVSRNRCMIALAALSQTASSGADQFFADLLRDEQIEATYKGSVRSWVEDLTRANRQRMIEDNPEATMSR